MNQRRDRGLLAITTLLVLSTLGAAQHEHATFDASSSTIKTGVIPVGDIPSTYTCPVSGAGSHIWAVELSTTIAHTNCADLELELTSPAGTTIRVSTDDGGTNEHVFNGRLWSGDAVRDTDADHVFANDMTARPLNDEGRVAAFRGENPNGAWTLRVTDAANSEGGILSRWDLSLTTGTKHAATSRSVYSGATGPLPECGNGGSTSMALVAGPGVLDCQIAPTATHGCNSIASSTGTPSASSGTLIVAFAGLNAQTLAVAFYGISGPASVPWNAQSLLCVKAPTERLSQVPGATGSTGGTAGACNGVRAFEFNSVIQGAYAGYLGTPMPPGQQVILQAWQRDPAASNLTSLSDALQIFVGP